MNVYKIRVRAPMIFSGSDVYVVQASSKEKALSKMYEMFGDLRRKNYKIFVTEIDISKPAFITHS